MAVVLGKPLQLAPNSLQMRWDDGERWLPSDAYSSAVNHGDVEREAYYSRVLQTAQAWKDHPSADQAGDEIDL